MSADGNHIYYNDEYDHAAPWAYWRWDRRTDERRRVLPSTEWNFHFCVSPNSDALVGDGNWSDAYVNLYRLDGKGEGHKERLCRRVTSKLRSEDQARFAPDGKSVFFNGDVDGVPAVFQVLIQ